MNSNMTENGRSNILNIETMTKKRTKERENERDNKDASKRTVAPFTKMV